MSREYDSPDGTEIMYGIYEAYYDDDGKVDAITEDPTVPFAESEEELCAVLSQMKAATFRPTLRYEDI